MASLSTTANWIMLVYRLALIIVTHSHPTKFISNWNGFGVGTRSVAQILFLRAMPLG